MHRTCFRFPLLERGIAFVLQLLRLFKLLDDVAARVNARSRCRCLFNFSRHGLKVLIWGRWA